MTGRDSQPVPGTRADAANDNPALPNARIGAGLRIGIASEGDPGDLRIRSGPAGITRGLSELGQDALPINLLPSGNALRAALILGILPRLRLRDLIAPRTTLTRLWAGGLASLPVRVLGRWACHRQLMKVTPLHGVIQFGSTELTPTAGLPMVTMQDSTVIQALRSYPWPHLDGLRPAEIDRRFRASQAAYQTAVSCCVATQWAADSLVADYGVPPQRVHVVGLGPNFDAPGTVPERDWSIPRFLFVGVDWKRKNGAAVLGAFARLRSDHPQATLDIVGEHPPLSADGVRQHGRLRLEDLKQRHRLQRLFEQATVCVVPSLHEPAGIVYLDAAGVGVPSIGTTNGGAATAIGDGGILVDPRSPRELLEAMRRLADPPAAIEMGQRARRHAEFFTWRKVAERILRALDLPGVDCSGLAEFL